MHRAGFNQSLFPFSHSAIANSLGEISTSGVGPVGACHRLVKAILTYVADARPPGAFGRVGPRRPFLCGVCSVFFEGRDWGPFPLSPLVLGVTFATFFPLELRRISQDPPPGCRPGVVNDVRNANGHGLTPRHLSLLTSSPRCIHLRLRRLGTATKSRPKNILPPFQIMRRRSLPVFFPGCQWRDCAPFPERTSLSGHFDAVEKGAAPPPYPKQRGLL